MSVKRTLKLFSKNFFAAYHDFRRIRKIKKGASSKMKCNTQT